MSRSEYFDLDPKLQGALEALQSYGDGGSRSALLPIDQFIREGKGAATIESCLAAILENEHPRAAKQYACEQLQFCATKRSVKALTRLLSDKQIATDARSVLESMPDEAASEALLAALPNLRGAERAGVINSLGVRRCVRALPALRRETQNPDSVVANAARDAVAALASSDQ